MKRFFFWLIPVIILVSLNWFSKVHAGDLANLSDAEKARLAEQYFKHRSDSPTVPGKSGANYYESSIEIDPPDSLQKVGSPKSLFDVRAASGFDSLMPFGHDLFSSPDGEILPPDDIASSSDYVLGPGDNLVIYLWGRVEKEFNLTIDREGKIVIPRVGEIIGWGQTLESFKETIRARLAKVYSEFDLAVSLGKISCTTRKSKLRKACSTCCVFGSDIMGFSPMMYMARTCPSNAAWVASTIVRPGLSGKSSSPQTLATLRRGSSTLTR